MPNSNRAALTSSATGAFGSDDIGEAASAWLNVLESEESDEPEPTTGQEDQDADDTEEEPDESGEAEEEPDDDATEGESDEDEEETEDDDEEPDETPEIDPEKYTVKVKVDGEEVEVTLKELQDGYSRTQDYTRKTMDLAERRKALEVQEQAVQEQLGQWHTLLNQFKARLLAEQSTRTEAEWERLKQEDELAYYAERNKELMTQQRIRAIEEEQQRVQQEQQKRYLDNLKETAQAEFKKLEAANPDWATDPEAKRRDIQAMQQYGQEMGFSQQELGSIIDHRALRVLQDAAKYRAMLAAKEKAKAKVKVTPKAKSLKAGTPSKEPVKSTKLRKANERLKREQTVDAAAGFFANLLDNEG